MSRGDIIIKLNGQRVWTVEQAPAAAVPPETVLVTDTMPRAKLLPCPFCGREAEYKEDAGSMGYTSPTVWVRCSNGRCFAVTEPTTTENWAQGLGHYTVRAQAFAIVAERWNQRGPGADE